MHPVAWQHLMQGIETSGRKFESKRSPDRGQDFEILFLTCPILAAYPPSASSSNSGRRLEPSADCERPAFEPLSEKSRSVAEAIDSYSSLGEPRDSASALRPALLVQMGDAAMPLAPLRRVAGGDVGSAGLAWLGAASRPAPGEPHVVLCGDGYLCRSCSISIT